MELRRVVSAIGGLRSAVAAEKSMQRPALTAKKQRWADQDAAREAAAAARHAAAAAEQAARDEANRANDAEVIPVDDPRHDAVRAGPSHHDPAPLRTP